MTWKIMDDGFVFSKHETEGEAEESLAELKADIMREIDDLISQISELEDQMDGFTIEEGK
tara:strand:- start:2938 stop:3117 length:180 start_codon:yes stop_codon:yes gene_type:complete